jgi:hypothetical protein
MTKRSEQSPAPDLKLEFTDDDVRSFTYDDIRGLTFEEFDALTAEQLCIIEPSFDLDEVKRLKKSDGWLSERIKEIKLRDEIDALVEQLAVDNHANSVLLESDEALAEYTKKIVELSLDVIDGRVEWEG